LARIRTVKPEFFRHEGLQDLERTHPGKYPMLVFMGLWGHCDKLGRLELNARMLKLDILPFLDFDMGETLELLCEAGFVRKYDSGSKCYGEIPSFTSHQRIGGKELDAPEKHPAPPWEASGTHRGSTGEAPGTHRGSTGEATGKHRGSTGEAPGKHPGAQEGKGREGNGDIAPSELPPSKDLLGGDLAASKQEQAVELIPLVGGKTYAVSARESEEWGKAYPRVDMLQTLREIRAWCDANPRKRKTHRGVRAFIVAWLAREQDRPARRR